MKSTKSLEVRYTSADGKNVKIISHEHNPGTTTLITSIEDSGRVVELTEQTIKGRVLGASIKTNDESMGYRYDYSNGEMLVNLNPEHDMACVLKQIQSWQNDQTIKQAKYFLTLAKHGQLLLIPKDITNVVATKLNSETAEVATEEESGE